MIKVILALMVLFAVGSVAVYFISAWRERNILQARDDEDE